MSLIGEIRKLELPTVLILVMVFLGTFAPGFLIIYLFKPDLVEKLDVIKLALFSGALTLPVMVVNAVAILIIFLSEAEKEEAPTLGFIFGGTLISIVAFYSAILGAYEYAWTFRAFLNALFLTDVFILVAIAGFRVVDIREERKKAENTKKQDPSA